MAYVSVSAVEYVIIDNTTNNERKNDENILEQYFKWLFQIG